jgi:hypothetical protein
MASYWIVVPRGNHELFELLSRALHGLPGFYVIVDRRTSEGQTDAAERRGSGPELGPDDVIVAERSQRFGEPSRDGGAHSRVPVRRRASGRSAARARGRYRLLTL